MAVRKATALAVSVIAIGLMISTATLAAGSRGVTVKLKASEAANAAVADTVQLYGASHALVIGIDKYTNGWSRLSNAVEDARVVAKELERQGFEVALKTDLKADALRTTLREFFAIKGADPDARLLLWYAGHGHTIGGEGFMVPADAPPDTSPAFLVSALPMRDFGSLVRLARSKHVLSVFDSCFSGTIFQARAGATPRAITNKTTKPVRQFITSGDAGQQVRDDGSFREYFVRALRGEEKSDFNGDGYVTGEELGLFLNQQMTALTSAAQTPKSGKLHDVKFNQGDFVFVLPGPVTALGGGNGSGGGADALVWATLQNSTNPVDFRTFLTTFPNSSFAPFARARIQAVGGTQTASLPPAQAAITDEPTRTEIREAQRLLTALGFDTRGVDGIAGSRTLEAVQRFRTDFRVSGSGIDHDLLKGLRNVFRAHQTATARNEALALKDAKPTPPAPQVAVARPAPVPVRLAPRPPSLQPGSTFRDCDGAVASVRPGLPLGVSFCGPKMVVVPAGSFDMGSSDRNNNAKPVHRVTIPRPFAVGIHTVRQAEWSALMGGNPSGNKRWRSVGSVSWDDAKDFLKRLSAKAGKEYRLLSEAEWEYAAADKNRLVPAKNAFGLSIGGYSLEWTEDCWNENYNGAPRDGTAWTAGDCASHVCRGDAWSSLSMSMSLADRGPVGPRFAFPYLLTFRVARTLD